MGQIRTEKGRRGLVEYTAEYLPTTKGGFVRGGVYPRKRISVAVKKKAKRHNPE